jgi:hypothetical protein
VDFSISEQEGELVAYFEEQDKLLIMYNDGTYITYKVDEDTDVLEVGADIAYMGKWDAQQVYTVVYTNGSEEVLYGKRFKVTTQTDEKYYHFIPDYEDTQLHFLSTKKDPSVEIVLVSAKGASEDPLVVKLDELGFPEKKLSAMGARIATRTAKSVKQVEDSQLSLL